MHSTPPIYNGYIFIRDALWFTQEELKKLQEQFKEVDTAVVGLDKEKRLWGIREGDLEGRVEEVEQERNDLLAQTEELTGE
eukprot:1632823-Pyramimonas_sp.AAC.1